MKVNGFFLIDKPKGVTSFRGVSVLRKICDEKKVGFVGTLDPLATGLMIFSVGDSTKLIPYLEKTDKIYEATIELGARSSTYDAEGDLEHIPVTKHPLRSTIEELLEEHFQGEVDQAPPIYSAIWVDGKRAYDLARKNQEVVLKKRKVHFYEVSLQQYFWPTLKLKVHCSSGTYIRSLAHDLGAMLGCGGHLKELRRLKIGRFDVKDAVPLNDLDVVNFKKHFLPVQEVFTDWTQVECTKEELQSLGLGAFIPQKTAIRNFPALAMFQGQCVGVLEPPTGRPGFLKYLRKFQ